MEVDLHATHGQERYQRDLRSGLELQVPDKKPREDRKGEVGDDAECAVEIRQTDDNVHTDALSRLPLVPKEGNRLTLEHRDKEKDSSSHN